MSRRQGIALRGGYHTTDRRLDRIPQHDERSNNYPIRALFADAPPALRSYTWRVPYVFNQGKDGQCVAYAIGHEATARPRLLPLARISAILADGSLYYDAQRRDPWDGGSYPGAVPHYEGTSVLAGMQAATAMGLYTSYRWARTEAEVAAAVSLRGPVILGINWYTAMFDPDPAGFLNLAGGVAGGHAITATGINLKGDYYILQNSWGPEWSVRGTARLRRADLATLLAEEGAEACLPGHESTGQPA